MITAEMLNQNICGIAIGLRFDPTFAIGDNLGKIADKILYSKKSYFNPVFFPLVTSDINTIMLRDEARSKYLVISTTDIILEVKLDINTDINKTVLELEYEKQILNSILSVYQVRGIQRVGYLTKYKIKDKEISDIFCTKTGVEANNLSMRFQKTYPMPDSMIKRDVNDYCSNIYTIVKAAKLDELIIHSDYQIHYQPFLDNYEDIPFKTFLKTRNDFNEKQLLECLNKYLDR
ncbi:MAG: hypothetical protein WC779_05350 [Candidatus Omnitrophota bacterium]|jgi:hypothetical protein